ncbi:MAG: hypothetical protein ABEJ05_05945 [Haloglomus sp.]
MDPALRRRVDIALFLLAVTAGSTAVAAAGVADVPTVAAGILCFVLLTGVTLFLFTTPEWARDDGVGAEEETD